MRGLAVVVKTYNAKGGLLNEKKLTTALAHVKKQGESQGYFVIAEFSGGAFHEMRCIEAVIKSDSTLQELQVFVATSPIP